VIEAEQTESGKTKRNDRFVAVPVESKTGRPPVNAIDTLDFGTAESTLNFS